MTPEPLTIDVPPPTSPNGATPERRSVIGRVIAVLDLFDEHRLSVGVDEIAAALELSPASAYRYASELLAAGLLAKTSGGFRLGPKIIELEYLIRSFDPILRAAETSMNALSSETGHDVLLCNVYGETIVNVLHIPGTRPVRITYTKGLPMPLFRGSQAHIILAHMDRRRLKRLYERSVADPVLAPDVRRIGETWPAFTAALKRIRQRGYYVADGELDEGVIGIAAPVLGPDGEIVGSLVLGLEGRTATPDAIGRLVRRLVDGAASLSERIARLDDRRAAGALPVR